MRGSCRQANDLFDGGLAGSPETGRGEAGAGGGLGSQSPWPARPACHGFRLAVRVCLEKWTLTFEGTPLAAVALDNSALPGQAASHVVRGCPIWRDRQATQPRSTEPGGKSAKLKA